MITGLSRLEPVTIFLQTSLSSIWSTSKKVVIFIKDFFLNAFDCCYSSIERLLNRVKNNFVPQEDVGGRPRQLGSVSLKNNISYCTSTTPLDANPTGVQGLEGNNDGYSKAVFI